MPSEETQLALMQYKLDEMQTSLKGAWEFIKAQQKTNEIVLKFMESQTKQNALMRQDNVSLTIFLHQQIRDMSMGYSQRRMKEEDNRKIRAKSKAVGTLPRGFGRPKEEPAQPDPVQKLGRFARLFGKVVVDEVEKGEESK